MAKRGESQYNPELHARNVLESKNRIVSGSGTVPYDVGEMAWAIPGGLHTTHKPSAERAAQLIDLMLRGEIKGPKIIREEEREYCAAGN